MEVWRDQDIEHDHEPRYTFHVVYGIGRIELVTAVGPFEYDDEEGYEAVVEAVRKGAELMGLSEEA